MFAKLCLLAQLGETETLGQSLPAWSKLGIAVAIVLGTYLFARFVSRKLRMPDIRWRVGLASFAIVAGLVICILGWPPKQGIDLSGGVILIFEIKPESLTQDDGTARNDPGGGAADEERQVVVKPPAELSDEELALFRTFVSLPDFDVSRVSILDIGEEQRDSEFERFTIDTSNRSIAAVESVLQGVFKGRLASNQVVVKSIALDAEMTKEVKSPPEAANGQGESDGASITTAEVRQKVNEWNDKVEKASQADLEGVLRTGLGDEIAARLVNSFAEWQARGEAEEAGLIDSTKMDTLLTKIKERIDPSGTKEIVVRKYGSRQIEIKIPKVNSDQIKTFIDRITNLGSLEFRILARVGSNGYSDHEDVVREANRLSDDEKELRVGGVVKARWVPVVKENVIRQFKADWERSNADDLANPEGFATRIIERPDGEKSYEILVLIDEWNVDGGYLARVGPGTQDGEHSVEFSFNTEGSRRFGGLTKEHQPSTDGVRKYHLAILLDGKLESTPTINSVITQQGTITGYGGPNGRQERDAVIAVLDAGRLPAALYETPVGQWTTDATLGADTVQRGMIAMAASVFLVLVFMISYYRFAGGVACFALLANLVLILAAMISIQAAFTLPGIAGLVLTVGMAIDGNVLIFERMREEINRGAAVRMAIRNGFSKAMSAIVDSNVTALITAVVLYVIGTDQIRGFAVTLILGLTMSMFTAVFCSRIIFDIWEKKFRPTTIKMMHVLSKPNIDFMKMRWPAAVVSIVIIAIGLVGVFVRGKNILDIDFLGGSSVQLVFKPASSNQALAPDGTQITTAAARLQDDDQNDNSEQESPAAEGETPSIQAAPDPQDQTEPPTVVGPQPPTPGDAPTDPAKTTDEETTPAVDPDAARKARFELGFAEQVSQSGVAKKIQAAIDALAAEFPLPEDASPEESEPIGFSMDTRGFEPDSTAAFNVWYVTFNVPERFGSPQEIGQRILDQVKGQVEQEPLFPSSFAIGGQVASDMRNAGIVALIASVFGIIIYLWIRFQRVAYGLAAVVAVVHDVLVMLGFIALSKYLTFIPTIDPFKIGLSVLAAFLTILGYSLNDTIVIFDRIREIKGKSPHLTRQMVNDSVNQTLSRTLITFILTFISTMALYFFGGQSIHGFAFAMVVGMIAGTYSTVFIATPVLLWLVEKGETAKPGANVAARLAPADKGPAAARAAAEP